MADKIRKDFKFESPFQTYIVEKQIGEGGSGSVYRVRSDSSDELAVKCLKPEILISEKLVRFKHELGFCAMVGHQNIIEVLDWGSCLQKGTKTPFYVMKYYPKTLRNLIDEKLPHERVLRVFYQILDGVEAAHLLNIYHRDIKPENILWDEESETAVVADFGIAHFSEEWLLTKFKTKTNTKLFNAQYAAPEQRERNSKVKVEFKADIFALGFILNEMFTQKVPLGTNFIKISDVAPEFEYLDKVVESMIMQDPQNRPSSIDEIKIRLSQFRKEFETRQKKSKLSKQVIPKLELDDPLINDPISINGFDFDTHKGVLIFTFNQAPNSKWIEIFRRPSHCDSNLSTKVSKFQIHGKYTRIVCEDKGMAQDQANFLKHYLKMTNDEYKNQLEIELRTKEKRERNELEKKIRNEEIRQQILENVKI